MSKKRELKEEFDKNWAEIDIREPYFKWEVMKKDIWSFIETALKAKEKEVREEERKICRQIFIDEAILTLKKEKKREL